MLVLTRKENEQIRIGNDITLTVVKVRGGGVRIGVEAPKNVRVMRSELLKNEEPAVSEIEDAKIEDVEIDDIAAVFAHPERNQRRGASPLRSMVAAARVALDGDGNVTSVRNVTGSEGRIDAASMSA